MLAFTVTHHLKQMRCNTFTADHFTLLRSSLKHWLWSTSLSRTKLRNTSVRTSTTFKNLEVTPIFKGVFMGIVMDQQGLHIISRKSWEPGESSVCPWKTVVAREQCFWTPAFITVTAGSWPHNINILRTGERCRVHLAFTSLPAHTTTTTTTPHWQEGCVGCEVRGGQHE